MYETSGPYFAFKPLVSYYILLTCFLAEYFILFLNKKKIKIFLFSASKVGKGSHPKLALATLTAFLTKYRSVSHFGWSCAPRLEPLGFVFFGSFRKRVNDKILYIMSEYGSNIIRCRFYFYNSRYFLSQHVSPVGLVSLVSQACHGLYWVDCHHIYCALLSQEDFGCRDT